MTQVAALKSHHSVPLRLCALESRTNSPAHGGLGNMECSGDPGQEGSLEEVLIPGCLDHMVPDHLLQARFFRDPTEPLYTSMGFHFSLHLTLCPDYEVCFCSPALRIFPRPSQAVLIPFVNCWHNTNCISFLSCIQRPQENSLKTTVVPDSVASFVRAVGEE